MGPITLDSCITYTRLAHLVTQLLELGLKVAAFALQLGADATLVLERRLGLLERPGEHLLGLVELAQLALCLLQLLREVGRLGLRAALGAVQLLDLALRLVELRQVLGDLRLEVLGRLLRRRLQRRATPNSHRARRKTPTQLEFRCRVRN